MLRKQIEKKTMHSETASLRHSSAFSDRDLEPRDLMEKLKEELTQKVLQAFSEREKISN